MEALNLVNHPGIDLSALKESKPDAITAIANAYRDDPREDKVNLGIGMIMDPDDPKKPWVPEAVSQVRFELADEASSTAYQSPMGHKGLLESQGRELIFGDEAWEFLHGGENGGLPNNTAAIQTVGGTHALRHATELLQRVFPADDRNLLMDPGWSNHVKIFEEGFDLTDYRHEDPDTRTYDHSAYMSKLETHPDGAQVLLQVAGYNGDGAERSEEQWDEIVQCIVEKGLIPILDFAYNGLANGWDKDNYVVKQLALSGVPTLVCVSNSKNTGMYGSHRLGSMYFINMRPDDVPKVQGTLNNKQQRPYISNPPSEGATILDRILRDDVLLSQFKNEVGELACQNILAHNRRALADVLGPDFEFLRDRRGIFAILKLDGLSDEALSYMREEHALYMPANSRINLGGIQPSKADEIGKILKGVL